MILEDRIEWKEGEDVFELMKSANRCNSDHLSGVVAGSLQLSMLSKALSNYIVPVERKVIRRCDGLE